MKKVLQPQGLRLAVENLGHLSLYFHDVWGRVGQVVVCHTLVGEVLCTKTTTSTKAFVILYFRFFIICC